MKTNNLRRLLVIPFALVIAAACVSLSLGDDLQRPSQYKRAAIQAQLATLEPLLEKNPEDCQIVKQKGILISTLATEDPKAYAAKAVDVLTRAQEMNPSDDETLGYLGSAITLMARTTANPFKKSGYVNRGCGYMDKAVRRSPDNIAVRMVRAANSMALPAFLNRRSKAVEDYEYLAQRFEREPGLPDTLKQTVYHNLAELYDQSGDTAKAEQYARLASAHE